MQLQKQSFQEAFRRLDACLLDRMKAYQTPALVMALTDRSRSIRESALGYAHLESRTPVQPDHLFAIGSVGKSFTAIAALLAKESGLLDLRAPVTAYLPWFEVQSSFPPITIRHLLAHSSGLPRGTDFSPDPRSEVFALRKLEAGFAPGAHLRYSDLGYKILGLVLEAVYQKPYAEIIREQILVPLEMMNTYAVTTSSLRPRMASGYRYLYDDRPSHTSQPIVPAGYVETNSGDGCIVSNAADMARFARMLLNEGLTPHGALLSEDSYEKLVSPMMEEEGEAYSFGLYLFEDEGFHIAGHGGDVPGYHAYMWLDLDNGLGSIVMMSEPYTPRASFLALEYFRAAYLGARLPEPPPLPDFTHIKDPGQYAGKFCSLEQEIEFQADGHQLTLCCGDQRVTLEERGVDTFYANHPDWDRFLFSFRRAEDGMVDELFYGPQWFIHAHYQGPRQFEFPPEWEAYCGHYRSHNPWVTNFRIFLRKDQLIYAAPNGDEEVLVPFGAGCFRLGEEEFTPERIWFDQIIDGQALRANLSGCPYYRFFTP